MKKFGEYIKDIRLKNKLTQQQLSNGSGVHVSHISRYEKSQMLPGIDAVWNMCEFLNLDKIKVYEMIAKEKGRKGK